MNTRILSKIADWFLVVMLFAVALVCLSSPPVFYIHLMGWEDVQMYNLIVSVAIGVVLMLCGISVYGMIAIWLEGVFCRFWKRLSNKRSAKSRAVEHG